MKCPYCTSEVADETLACQHCTRDLHLIKALWQRIAELEQKVRDLEQRGVAVPTEEASVPTAKPVAAIEQTPSLLQRVAEIALLWLAPLLLLLIAHELITIVYDASTLWLRVVSLVIPLPFGLILMSRRHCHFGVWIVAAFVMAALAVLGMSTITSLTDATPILPQDLHEWREFVEYAASVGFSYLTGMVLGRMLWRRRQLQFTAEQAHGLALKLVGLLSKGHENAEKVNASIQKLKDLGSSLTAAATTATAVYTGLQGFIGR